MRGEILSKPPPIGSFAQMGAMPAILNGSP